MEQFLERFEHLLDAKLETIVVRIQAVDDASIARVAAVSDRQQEQRQDIRANTKAIGELTGQTSRLEREMSQALGGLRADFRKAIHDEVAQLSEQFVHRDEIERRANQPVRQAHDRISMLERKVVAAMAFSAGALSFDLLPLLVGIFQG